MSQRHELRINKQKRSSPQAKSLRFCLFILSSGYWNDVSELAKNNEKYKETRHGKTNNENRLIERSSRKL